MSTTVGDSRLNKFQWTPEEDALLAEVVCASDPRPCWNTVARSLPGRTSKSCRKRWIYSLNPSCREGHWTNTPPSDGQGPLEFLHVPHLLSPPPSSLPRMPTRSRGPEQDSHRESQPSHLHYPPPAWNPVFPPRSPLPPLPYKLMRSHGPSFYGEQDPQQSPPSRLFSLSPVQYPVPLSSSPPLPPLFPRDPRRSPISRKSRISRNSSLPIVLSNGEPHRPSSSPHIPQITHLRAQCTPTPTALKDAHFAKSDDGLESVHVYTLSDEPTNTSGLVGETEPEIEPSPHLFPQYPNPRANSYAGTSPVPNPKSRIAAYKALLPRCTVYKNKHDLLLAQPEISELWSKRANYLSPPSSLAASSSSPHVPQTNSPRAEPAPVALNTNTTEVASNESLTGVRSLLSCRFNVSVVRGFQGSEAQTFVDFLDQALAQSFLDEKLWQRGLRLLSKVCKDCSIIPTSYVRQRELIRMGTVRYRSGFADVSDGEYLGLHVAIKSLRMNDGGSPVFFKRLCREIISWKHLTHPNILPLFGVSVSADRRCFSILTEWMTNGNVIQYTRSNPKANRLKLVSDVASGVSYLHEISFIHGDLKGENILVDTSGTARVADFGLMTMTDLSTAVLSKTAVSSGGTLGWMSPELLDPPRFGSNGSPTRESDCYALGMVIYEVLTGLRPFHHLIAPTPVPAVMRGERPIKPFDAESLGFSDRLWELVQLCWSESSSARPTVQQLLDCIFPASLTWVPPPVYPAVVSGSSSIVDSDLFDSLLISAPISRSAGTADSIGGPLVLIIVLLLFLCT